MQKNKKKPRHCHTKSAHYQVTNWNEYNRSLTNRGNITLWLSDDVVESWYYQGEKQKGAQYVYSELCIETCCVLRKIYHLPYRQTEGFVSSILKVLGESIETPDYSVICRRNKSLQIIDDLGKIKGEKIHIVVDSTGLKVYGEGEWKVRQYGYGKHRTWRKIHMAIDPETCIIHACELTTNNIDDASMVKPLLNNIIGNVNKFGGDGGL